ncbi:MAG: iron ABC transporter permease, partial [Cyanobacteria bacterium J06639_16]
MPSNWLSIFKFRPKFKPVSPGWALAVLAVVALVSLPVLVVFSSVFSDSGEIWQHLAETVLPTYLLNSLWLMLGVSVGVLGIGVGTAWLVTLCRFPGSRIFEWALLLPLAAPAYLLAYSYADVLDYFGWVQTALRAVAGWERATDYWFPNVRSLWGAIAMFSFTLYPYVYMLTRVAFMEQSTATLEASRSLGCGPWRSFSTVALPLARPAIMAGLSLALMETLNDFGTVQYFGVETFTTGIYRTWFSLGERIAAAQLAAMLMLFILGLILLERWSRRQARYYQTSGRLQRSAQYQLGLGHSLLAILACFVPIALGLLVPGGFLLNMTLRHLDDTLDRNFWPLVQHSIILATIAAAIAAVISLVLAYGVRLQNGPLMRFGVRIASMGYAVPGSVIAVGILIPVTRVDNAIATWAEQTLGISVGLLL